MATKAELLTQIEELEERLASAMELAEANAEAAADAGSAMADDDALAGKIKVAMDYAPVYHRTQAPKLWNLLDELVGS